MLISAPWFLMGIQRLSSYFPRTWLQNFLLYPDIKYWVLQEAFSQDCNTPHMWELGNILKIFIFQTQCEPPRIHCVFSETSRAQTLENLVAICPHLPDTKIDSLKSPFLHVFHILYSNLVLMLHPRNVSTCWPKKAHSILCLFMISDL